MIRFAHLIPLTLAACVSAPAPLPPAQVPVPAVVADVRPVMAKDTLRGRWHIIAVNGTATKTLWIDLGREGLGTVTKTANEIFVGSPQPPTRAFLGCNNWHPNGWTRNGDKLILGTEMSIRTERGCGPETEAVDEAAYQVLRKAMTMELSPPDRLRLINEHGTLELVREAS